MPRKRPLPPSPTGRRKQSADNSVEEPETQARSNRASPRKKGEHEHTAPSSPVASPAPQKPPSPRPERAMPEKSAAPARAADAPASDTEGGTARKPGGSTPVDVDIPLAVLNPDAVAEHEELRDLYRELDFQSPRKMPSFGSGAPREHILKPPYRQLPDVPLNAIIYAAPDEVIREPNIVWRHPGAFVRPIEPNWEELDQIVEYDLDTDDEGWLLEWNRSRKRDSASAPFTVLQLESAIDRLEKYTFRDVPFPPVPADPIEAQVPCNVCEEPGSGAGNKILICDVCSVAVHQRCYGIPVVPDGRFLCRRCDARETNGRCLLCPQPGGALKRTVEKGGWVHASCALWNKDITFADMQLLEPAVGVPALRSQRAAPTCYVCNTRQGACILCSDPTCTKAFHVTCAMQGKLCLDVAEPRAHVREYRAYCDVHAVNVPPTNKRVENRRAAAVARAACKGGKLAAARARFVAMKAEKYAPAQLAKLMPRIPPGALDAVLMYWAEKRQFGLRGPFLRRLDQVPPPPLPDLSRYTLSQAHRELRKLKAYRAHAERMRNMLELLKRREKLKNEQVRRLAQLTAVQSNVHFADMNDMLLKLEKEDTQNFFSTTPASGTALPLNFGTIRLRLCGLHFSSRAQFVSEVRGMLQAAMAPPTQKTSAVYKEAARLVAVLASLADASSSKPSAALPELVRIDRMLRRRTSPPPPSAAGVTHSHSRVHSPVQQAPSSPRGPSSPRSHYGHRDHSAHGRTMPEGESDEVDIEAVSEASKRSMRDDDEVFGVDEGIDLTMQAIEVDVDVDVDGRSADEPEAVLDEREEEAEEEEAEVEAQRLADADGDDGDEGEGGDEKKDGEEEEGEGDYGDEGSQAGQAEAGKGSIEDGSVAESPRRSVRRRGTSDAPADEEEHVYRRKLRRGEERQDEESAAKDAEAEKRAEERRKRFLSPPSPPPTRRIRKPPPPGTPARVRKPTAKRKRRR